MATTKKRGGTSKKSAKKAAKASPARARRRGAAASGNAVVRTASLLEAAEVTVQVSTYDTPPRVEPMKRIHPRKIIPVVAEGKETSLTSTTRRALPADETEAAPLAARGVAGRRAASSRVVLQRNTALTQPGREQTSSIVNEPSVAVHGTTVLYTGNWYAAMSTDGGRRFRFLDPREAFGTDIPGDEFCCDQIAHYIARIDTFVWLLQSTNATDTDNVQRILFATTADAIAGRWRRFDITTSLVDLPGAFLDYPDIAVGENMLYVTTNAFRGRDEVFSVVVRMPIEGFRTGSVTADVFVTAENFSCRVAQNCGTTAFFAAHEDTSTLRVFTWEEEEPEPTFIDVPVARWVGLDGYISRTPDGKRWLDRADPRITGATRVGEEVWFAWGVDAGGASRRPHPHGRIAKINTSTMRLVEDMDLWLPDNAICFAALATNANDEVGVSYMVGGPTKHPTHVVGILTGTRSEVISATGARSPLKRPGTGKFEWGDYLTVRPLSPDGRLFAATGFTLARTSGPGNNKDATPRYVTFGRSSDIT